MSRPTRIMCCGAGWNSNVLKNCPRCGRTLTAEPVYGVFDPDYARFLSIARCIAKMSGYAIAVHGSFTRDLDVVAIPWIDKPQNPIDFVNHVAQEARMLIHHPMETKEHGRMVWTLMFPTAGDPRFIDLSIMPTITNHSLFDLLSDDKPPIGVEVLAYFNKGWFIGRFEEVLDQLAFYEDGSGWNGVVNVGECRWMILPKE